ncbi:hypothetical protein FACS1894137_15440 [Spirochaetia bacterium]|nr:hypothetical protein FACS1894137_15440 [Spirochaetia bacterium]
MSPVSREDTGVDAGNSKYLDAGAAVTQWQNFIAEDRRSFSPLANRLFKWDFIPVVPEDEVTDYWVQIGIFNRNRKADADELLRALKKHIANSKIEDMGNGSGWYAVRIGPFKYEWEVWRIIRDIKSTR